MTPDEIEVLRNIIDSCKSTIEVVKNDVDWLKKSYWALFIPILIGVGIQLLK